LCLRVTISLSKQKTGKKQKQELVQKEKKVDSKNIEKLMQGLDELKKKGKYVDVAVCPVCKSLNLRRVKSTSGDMSGHLGWLPVKYECLDCGWRGRLEVYATNKKQNWREVTIMAEARDLQAENRSKKNE
jgi:uncharacterized protein YbaR (Trm112 family)